MIDDNAQKSTQKFAYEIIGGNAVILRCFSRTEKAEIPREIDGHPVTKIAPYAFSAHMDERDLIGKRFTDSQNPSSAVLSGGYGMHEELPALCGDRLEEIWIPDTVTQVGRYCFYDCKGLKKIAFTDALKDWGSGAFTRCHHIEKLEIHIYNDGRSTLKDVLMELPELMIVDYYLEGNCAPISGTSRATDSVAESKMNREVYSGTRENGQFARLVFPEFYEEGIENTPARLINYEMHGSGMYYRNCFQQRVLSFHEYDSRFNHAGFQESFQVLSELVLGRLRYPLELAEGARKQYEAFIIEEKDRFSRFIIEKKEMDTLIWYAEFLSQLLDLAKDTIGELLSQMTEVASSIGFHEGLSYLMDYQHRHGKKKKKMSFDL